MPIYEYLCESCGRISERMQKMSEQPLRTCPECGSRKVARLVSRTAFQLKGGGWYADLYSSKKQKEAKDTGGEAGAAAERTGKEKAAAPPAPAASGPSAAKEKPAKKASTGQSDS